MTKTNHTFGSAFGSAFGSGSGYDFGFSILALAVALALALGEVETFPFSRRWSPKRLSPTKNKNTFLEFLPARLSSLESRHGMMEANQPPTLHPCLALPELGLVASARLFYAFFGCGALPPCQAARSPGVQESRTWYPPCFR